ncbi:MAG: hypothetical protein NW215_02880 [Hyphomicrobiales bacterium]|nr:hypothetical protein [Hyphomicrobiales bacterium]
MLFRKTETVAAAEGRKALALLQDVLFDLDGDYYIAVPLDSKDPAALALERLALALEAAWLLSLAAAATPEQAKAKLRNRNSSFTGCAEFRIYHVESGAWTHILEVLGAAEPHLVSDERRRTQPADTPLIAHHAEQGRLTETYEQAAPQAQLVRR